MVKFGKYLKTHINPEWKEHYIDYSHLKTKIKEIKKILEKDLANYHSGESPEDHHVSSHLNSAANLPHPINQITQEENVYKPPKISNSTTNSNLFNNDNKLTKTSSALNKDTNAATLYEMNLDLIKDASDSEGRPQANSPSEKSSKSDPNKIQRGTPELGIIAAPEPKADKAFLLSKDKKVHQEFNSTLRSNNNNDHARKTLSIPNYIIYEQQLIEKSRLHAKNFRDKMKEDVLISRKCINISHYVHDFLSSVDQEIKKFYNFFKKLESELKRQLNSILTREVTFFTLNLTEISDEILYLEQLSKLTLDLSYFININITAIRKILKKFDKSFGLTKNPVAVYYLNEVFHSETNSLNYILQFKIIDESSALVEKLSGDLECALEKRIAAASHSDDNLEALKEPLLFKNLDIELEKLSDLNADGIVKIFKKKFNKLRKKVEKIDDANNLIRTSVEVWTLMMKSNMRVVDDYFEGRDKKHLKHEEEIKEEIIEKLTPQINREDDIQLDYKSLQNIWITLVHTFLYMTNCYIIQPTNASYVQELGASPMLSGLIMGMTPFAAIFCTFIYSKWTNSSYKHPLLFSSFCFIVGNLLYSFADPLRSLFVMGIGRFFIGLASARVVNRRYLIDKIPHQLIMHYSLLYVVLTCMGMAGGPFFAVILLQLPDYQNWYFKFNQFTNPGWFFAVVWVIFGIYISGAFIDNLEVKLAEDDKRNSNEIDKTDQISNKEEIKSNENLNSSRNNNNNNINNQRSINNNDIEKSTSVSSNLIEYDIQNLIREQENTFSYMSISFLLLVLILLLIRMTTESLLVLTPIFLPTAFSLSNLAVSVFLFFTSFIVFPISYVINNFSKSHPERKIILILMISCTISCVFLVNIPGFMNSTLPKFIVFYSVLFVACNILESVDSALLAKIFPANMHLGVCNSGFTIIMATTGGRFIGSIIITVFGILIGRDLVFDFLMSFYLLAFGTISYFVYKNYSDLRVKAIARIIQKKEM